MLNGWIIQFGCHCCCANGHIYNCWLSGANWQFNVRSVSSVKRITDGNRVSSLPLAKCQLYRSQHDCPLPLPALSVLDCYPIQATPCGFGNLYTKPLHKAFYHSSGLRKLLLQRLPGKTQLNTSWRKFTFGVFFLFFCFF